MQVFNIPIDEEQKETTIHGSFDFPLAVYDSVMSRNVLGYINWHWHEELQFCLVTLGTIDFFVGHRQFHLNTGEGIFVNSGCLHMARPGSRPDSSYICVDAGPRLLSGFPGSIFEKKYVLPYIREAGFESVLFKGNVDWQAEVLVHIRKIYELCENRAFGYEIECAALLGQIWLHLLRSCPGELSADNGSHLRNNAYVQAILNFVNDHYNEPLTISMIAKEVSLSASECCRLFKRVTGDTIFSYLQTYRLSKSVTLLKDSSLPISQIAYETGFCSTSYFIEVFKKKLNTTPLRYRKTF